MTEEKMVARIKELFIDYLIEYFIKDSSDSGYLYNQMHAAAYEKLLREFADAETVKSCFEFARMKAKASIKERLKR